MTGADCTDQNLAALREAQPELAARLGDVHFLPSVQRVTGRDGTPNYVITGDDGTRRWFGGSSMPTISASPLVEQTVSSAGSVFLPAVMTGLEAKQLAERLDPHCAVFVFEPDLLNLRLALSLHDWSELIARGRLVPISGDDVETALTTFLDNEPGYEFPTRMVYPPQMEPQQREAAKASLESAGQAFAARQRALAQALSDDICRDRRVTIGDKPRLVITSVDPRPDVIAYAHAIESAAGSLGWPVATCFPEHPAKAHAVARLRAVQSHDADLVITVNSCPGRGEREICDARPTVAWFLPSTAVQAALSEGLPDRVLAVASTPRLRKRLVEGGAPENAVELVEIGADACSFTPLAPDDPDVEPDRCDVAVLCDLADLQSEKLFVSMQSHVRLFKDIVRSGPSWVDRYEPSQAETILARVEKRSDIHLTEKDIRKTFIQLIRNAIAPTIVARATVERLVRAGPRVKVWGRNWGHPGGSTSVVQGPIPPSVERNRIAHAAGVVLCPLFTNEAVQMILDALVAGGRVVCRHPGEALEQNHPHLGKVLRRVPTFTRLKDLPGQLNKLLRDPRSVGSKFETLHTTVRTEHTLAHRLEHIRQLAQRFFADS